MLKAAFVAALVGNSMRSAQLHAVRARAKCRCCLPAAAIVSLQERGEHLLRDLQQQLWYVCVVSGAAGSFVAFGQSAERLVPASCWVGCLCVFVSVLGAPAQSCIMGTECV